MCLIALAHRASARFPLVIAANRDEEYERPSRDAHFWDDAPDVLGGRDTVAGGSWLAITRGGRFAAVTNLRGAVRKSRSRGALVRDFVTTTIAPHDYAEEIKRGASEYAAFHLLAGAIGGDVFHITPADHFPLPFGAHAFSNAPAGEHWPKMTVAREEMERALHIESAETLVETLLQFLQTPRGTRSVEDEIFIAGDRYGTRASTVIIATGEEILFAEQTFTRGGVPGGERRSYLLSSRA